MSIGCVALLGLAGVWLLSDAILGGRILAPGDLLYFAVPPFTAVRPPGLTRAANPTLTDLVFVVEPYLLHAREAIRGGALPIWDPNVGTGRPLGAQAAGQLFPTSWLAYVLPFWRSLGFVALAKLLLTAGGTFLFGRALGLRPVAAALAAGAFAFGTQYVVWLGHPMTDVVGLMPWMFLFAERLGARGRPADAACLGVTIGLGLFGGHPEALLVAVSGAGAYFAARVARQPEPAGPRVRLALGSVVLAGAVGGLGWLPLAELVGQSTRAGRVSAADSVHQLLVGLAFPEWWGRPDKRVFDAGGATGLSGVFLGRAYLGVVPILLCAGMLAVPRRAAQRFFAVAALAAVALMVDVPGLRRLATHVPPLSLMVLHYWIWLAVFSVAMLAGLGLDQLLRAPRERQVRALQLMGAAAAVPVVVALALDGGTLAGAWRGALDQLPVGRPDPGSAGVAAAGALLRWILIAGAGLAVAALGLRFRRLRSGAMAFVLVLSLADVVTIGRGYQPALTPALAHPPAPASVALARADTRLAGPSFDLAPNLAELYGRADVRVEDLPEIARYSRVFTALGGSVLRAFGDSVIPPDPSLGESAPAAPAVPAAPAAPVAPAASASSRTLVDLLGAGEIVDAGGSRPTAPGVRVAFGAPGQRLLENARALPRAFGAYAWEPAASLDAAVAALRGRSAADLARRPVIEGAPAPGGVPPKSGGGPVATRILASSDTAVTVAVRMARPGYVVLGDLYYPGWRAEVDGHRTPILPADGAFRAVATGAGRHVVRFVYRPASVWVGGVLTVVGLLSAAGVIVVSRRRDTPGMRAGR